MARTPPMLAALRAAAAENSLHSIHSSALELRSSEDAMKRLV
jgi:hypothetical protein